MRAFTSKPEFKAAGDSHHPARSRGEFSPRQPGLVTATGNDSGRGEGAARPGGHGVESGPAAELPHAVRMVLNSPGNPLDPATRAWAERRAAGDFSRVRVHTDGTAARSAQGLGAAAYAAGPHLVFGPGQYRPTSESGRRLIAHELVHVLQGSVPPMRSARRWVSDPSDRAEAAARSAADLMLRGADPAAVREIATSAPQTAYVHRDFTDPDRLADVHARTIAPAPTPTPTSTTAPTGGSRVWLNATAPGGGTAALIIRQAKAAITQFVRDNPRSVRGTLPNNTSEADIDRDVVAASQQLRTRFPMITVNVSNSTLQTAARVMSSTLTSTVSYQRQFLASRLIEWSDIEHFAIRDTDPRFIAMLDTLLADRDVGGHIRTLSRRVGGFIEPLATPRRIHINRAANTVQRMATLKHEVTHFYRHGAFETWLRQTRRFAEYNEGITELLAREIMSTGEVAASGSAYAGRMAVVQRDIGRDVPLEDIAYAFFAGQTFRLETTSAAARTAFATASTIPEGASRQVEADRSRTGPGLTQTVVARRHFRFMNLGVSRPDPKPEHIAFFRRIKARDLDPRPAVNLRFEGHASTPGSRRLNLDLSRRRSAAFYNMARTEGVPNSRLVDWNQPPHRGEAAPTATEVDAATRAFNRRVEMTLTNGAAAPPAPATRRPIRPGSDGPDTETE